MALPRLRVTACLLAASSATLGACGTFGRSATNTISSRELLIYTSLPLTGPVGRRSRGIVNGEKLALHEVGGRAGHYKVSMVALDDTDPSVGTWGPGQTSTNAKTAAQDPNAVAYLGDWDSGATAVSLPIVNGAGILQISPASTYVGFTQSLYAGKGEPDRYYPLGSRTFGRLMPDDSVQASAALTYLRQLHIRRLYVIRDREVFDADITGIVSSEAPTRGVQVVKDEGLSPNPGDDPALIQRMAHSPAQALFYGGAPTQRAALVLRRTVAAAHRLRLVLPYFVATPDFLSALGRTAQRATFVTTPALPESQYPASAAQFGRSYRATFGVPPGLYAAYGYESMKLVLDLIRQAGKRANDRALLVRHFLAVRRRDSVLGQYSITPSGTISLTRYAGYRVRRGQLVFDRLLMG